MAPVLFFSILTLRLRAEVVTEVVSGSSQSSAKDSEQNNNTVDRNDIVAPIWDGFLPNG